MRMDALRLLLCYLSALLWMTVTAQRSGAG